MAITPASITPKVSTAVGGPLISLAALLWATDAIFRAQLSAQYSPLVIVTVTHLITLVVTAPLLLAYFKAFKRMNFREFLALIFLSLGGSLVAMVLFTSAFATTSNYTVPILLQKLQPIVAILLARLILKEPLQRNTLLLAALAIFGAYLVSFGDLNAWQALQDARLKTVLYTLGAATIWGGCTVAGRYFLRRQSFIAVTAGRYVIAALCLVLIISIQGQWPQIHAIATKDIKSFLLMAYIPGLLALFIYYCGLKRTPASLATLCELAFPIGAIIINWVFLDSPLNHIQITGASLLLASITAISWRTHTRTGLK